MRLEHLATTANLLVALDFDGTLAPLVDDPLTARMVPAARTAVDALAALPATEVAFVSGRSLHHLREIAEHADDSPLYLAGSHGAEYWVPGAGEESERDPDALALRDRLRTEAEERAAALPGAWIEPKSFGFGVHTRTVADKDAARAVHDRIDALMAAEAPHWRRRHGHDLVEYAFRAEGKDAAVARLRDLTGATAVVFAGDDVTDEDALRSLGSGDLGIRVGPGETAASLRVADTAELAALLSRLVRMRAHAQE